MKIKKLTEKSCNDLYENIVDADENYLINYHYHKKDFVPLTKNMDLVATGNYEIEDKYFSSLDFQLKLIDDNSGNYDFENCKIIYEIFKDLTPSDANDERLWVRLTHDHCHKYIVKRWMTASNGKIKSKDVIKERFFFKGRSQNARVRNGISRLWWIAFLTIQHNEINEEERWKYTKAICESQDFITSILERTLGTYQNVRFAILEYYIENKESFGNSKSKKIQKLIRDLNNFGGVNLLPLMTKEDVKLIIQKLM
jgi:hypothetical protein